MKLLILLNLLIVGITLAAIPSDTSLMSLRSQTNPMVCQPSEIWDFIMLLPIDKILCIIEEHLESDVAFCKVITILQSVEFSYFLQAIRCNEEVTKLIECLQNIGISERYFIIEKIIRNVIIKDASCSCEGNAEASLRPLLDDIRAVLPINDLMDLFNDKLENSSTFQELIEKLKNKEYHEIFSEVLFLEEVQELFWLLRYWEVAIDDLLTSICYFLWWEPCYVYDPLSHNISSRMTKLLKLSL